jgi:hypothetical protein
VSEILDRKPRFSDRFAKSFSMNDSRGINGDASVTLSHSDPETISLSDSRKRPAPRLSRSISNSPGHSAFASSGPSPYTGRTNRFAHSFDSTSHYADDENRSSIETVETVQEKFKLHY